MSAINPQISTLFPQTKGFKSPTLLPQTQTQDSRLQPLSSEAGVQTLAFCLSPKGPAIASLPDFSHLRSPTSLPDPLTRGLRAGSVFMKSFSLSDSSSLSPRPLRARIGDDHLLLFQKEQLRSTKSPVFHPKYQPCSGPILPHRSDEHDLMMLKLSSPVVLTPSVHPVQLPFRCAQPGQECQVAGWGTTAARRGKNWTEGVYFKGGGLDSWV